MASSTTAAAKSRLPEEQQPSALEYVLQSVIVPAVIGFTPGAVGGVCNVLVGHPIDLVKVRQQTAAAGATAEPVGQMLRTIFRTQGVAGIYAGVAAPLVAVVPAFALTFSSYEWAKQKQLSYNGPGGSDERMVELSNNNDDADDTLSLPQVAIAGGVSGIFLGGVLGPLERIKCLMQVQTGNKLSFAETVQSCYNTGGVRSLVRGTLLTIVRDVPGNAAYFCGFEGIRRTLLAQRPEPAWQIPITLLSGGLAGVFNWIVAIPIDVVKSRWQTAPTGQYSSVRVCATALVQQGGWQALFRGLRPALMRAFPANAACFTGVQLTSSCIEYLQGDSGAQHS